MHQSKKNYYPWVLISLCALFLFYKYILQVYPSVITDNLMQFFHLTGKGLGNLAACFSYSYLIFQLIAGPLIDKYSPRIVTSCAILLAALGTLLFMTSHHILFAEIGRAMIGAGAAFATVSYLKMAALWFRPNQYTFVAGLLATAAMMGAILGEAPLAALVAHIGWQASIFCCAVIGFVIAGLFFLIARDKEPENASALISDSTLRLENILAVITSKKNWILTFYSGLSFTPLIVFAGLWGPAFLRITYKLNTTEAASFCSFVFLGLAFGGPVLGYLADRTGKRFTIMIIGTLVAFLSITAVLYVPLLSLYSLGALLFLFGFCTGAFILCFAVGKDINPPLVAASVVALINTGDSLFGSITQPLTGALLDHFWSGGTINGAPFFDTHDYQIALCVLPLYLLIGLGLVLWLARQINHESTDALDTSTAHITELLDR